ncbi:patatin-like phospholipase family protein [Polynucleobacter sp. CS-Odin-A6]|nr:patatin-like phospholipase family protein [Polynucleobacter sp. CS-Odin-A6]MBU3622008.1 patatin-like phospholipase family protein [Polynucleobacter sp. CS-Odin-A6]
MRKFLIVIFGFAVFFTTGCANRPINPPIAKVNLNTGYREFSAGLVEDQKRLPETAVILALSGGGTRAAAFSYGVLEALRDIEVVDQNGKVTQALHHINLISGVSGGSFTALSYGLYGDELFDIYESAFLKRDVQGELISRALNPFNWTNLASTGWGRSEMAAELYDEILFKNATYEDLRKRNGPMILASATDISSGAGFTFDQGYFDYLCSDLDSMPISRAAASSSAVPFVLSPVTINNYGGSCQFEFPSYLKEFTNFVEIPRPAARIIRQMGDLKRYHNGEESPYIHLVDGGLSDNLAMRPVLDFLQGFEAMHLAGKADSFDGVKRVIVIVVNSLSSPSTNWNKSIDGPGSIELLIKATGVPIDHYSYEEVEALKDTQARWKSMKTLRNSKIFSKNKNQQLENIVNTPNIDLFTINVAFNQLEDREEFEYLNGLPTSFSLPSQAIDRLRVAARKIILSSPDFQRIMTDGNLRLINK